MPKHPHPKITEAREVATALAGRGGVLMWFEWAWSNGLNTLEMAREWRISEASAVIILEMARQKAAEEHAA